MISEDEIVSALQSSSFGFIGDDAALLPSEKSDSNYVVTKDLLVQDLHFRTKYFTPQDLAHKALHVNLSDLAAMGAKPLYILCGISIPDDLQDYCVKFLDYLTLACKKAEVVLIGGDTTASKARLFISITAIGSAVKNYIKTRSTAKVDDIICIAGNLGFAHTGLTALEKGFETDKKYTKSFLRPTAKTKEGIWLGKKDCITGMMDISDGLYVDLRRLCKASNKGAILNIELLKNCLESKISIKTALEGGEDYGLLFTTNPKYLFTVGKMKDIRYS